MIAVYLYLQMEMCKLGQNDLLMNRRQLGTNILMGRFLFYKR